MVAKTFFFYGTDLSLVKELAENSFYRGYTYIHSPNQQVIQKTHSPCIESAKYTPS